MTIWPNVLGDNEEPMVGHSKAWRSKRWTESDIAAAVRRIARDESGMRQEFWRKARRFAARLPFAEDLLAAYYCAFDRDTPASVKAALIAALAYFVLPFDFVPDMLPLFGFADDAAVLATALRLVAGAIRPEHRDAARRAIARGLAEY
jgi:uncharacterized membrane protein YkvA (DUF1232 family)